MKHLKMKICVLYVVVAFLKVYRCASLPVDPDPVEIIHEKFEKDQLQDAQESQAEKLDLPSVDAMSSRTKRSIFDTPRILNEVDGPINVQHHKGVWHTTPFVLTSTNPPETTTLPPTTTTSTESPRNDEIPIWLQLLRLFISPLFYSEETTRGVSVEAEFTTQAVFTSIETEVPATTDVPTTTTTSTTAEPPATTVNFGLNLVETNAIDKPRIFVQLFRLIIGPMFELKDQPDTPLPNTEELTALPATPTTQEPTTSTTSAYLSNPSFEFRRSRTVPFSPSTEPAFLESTEPGQPIGVEVQDNNNAAMMNPIEPQQQWNPFMGPKFVYFPPRFDFAGPAF